MAQHTFAGSIPENYDRYLGPLIMEPYARDLARRLPATGMKDVLELAAGTGILTRHLRDRLDENTRLVATDISEGMLGVAKAKPGYGKPVEWKAVDATKLPFPDNSFDAVISQFGVMFFPDKDQAVREIYRVLRPGGRFLFNVWDKLEFNDFANIARSTILPMFESDPPEFYNLPFGYHDHYVLRTLLRNAGFMDVALATLEMRVQATPRDIAMGFVEGNPISVEITDRLGKNLSEVTQKVEQAIGEEHGVKMAKGKARAIIVGGRKPYTATASTPAPTPEAAPQPKPAPKAVPKTAAKPATPKPAAAKPPAPEPKPAAQPAPSKKRPIKKNPLENPTSA